MLGREMIFMTYVLKFNGEKVKTFDDPLYAKAWADHFCRGGKIEVIPLTETNLPKASKIRFNVNKCNPYTL